MNNIGVGELSDATNESSTTIAENGTLLGNELVYETAYVTTVDTMLFTTMLVEGLKQLSLVLMVPRCI